MPPAGASPSCHTRTGVIGAGIGGTSAAYFLRQKFGREVQIDVFERGEVGGRMATLTVDGEEVETGGVFFSAQAVHMKHFVKELGLPTISGQSRPVGVYTGDEFVFKESGFSIWDLIRLFWKYGLNPLRMYLWAQTGMDRIVRIYGYQDQDRSFSSNEALFGALGGGGCSAQGLNETIGEVMRKTGYSQKFISEIAAPIMQFLYGESADINCFVGLTALAAVLPGSLSVKGGNKLVCGGLLSASEAQLIPGTVLSLEEKTQQKGHSEKQYEVTFYSESGVYSETYDIVLIAAPLQPEIANISFLNFNPPIPEFFRPYHRTVVTVVSGHINATFFGYRDPSQFKLRNIAVMKNHKLIIDGMSLDSPDEKSPFSPPVWKIYSPESLTEEQLNLLFSSYGTVLEKRWWSWPEFYPPIQLPPIILHHHLYYLNGAELIVSAMEMSAVAAKNAVLLAHRRWYGKGDEVE